MSKLSTHEAVREEAIRSQFTNEEWYDRTIHVATLRAFGGSSVEAAKALAAIRDKNLYRPHKTLKEFCQRECGWSERRLFQIISFAEVKSSLPVKSEPLVQSERQARELKKVPVEKRVEVLDKAKRNGQITAKSIKRVAAEIVDLVEDSMGYPITAKALPYWNRRHEVSELLRHISAAKSALQHIVDGDPLYRRVVSIRSKRDRLEEFYNEFKGALPAYVCYSCDGLNVDKCRLCGGTGVVSEFEWRSKADPDGHKRRERFVANKKGKHPF